MGRPRDPDVDRAIEEAARKLMRERGYDALSIEGVAAEAGVGKGAIYRRYADKTDLVVGALAALSDEEAALEPSGETREDLAQLPRHIRQNITRAGTATVGALIVSERSTPELLASFRERVVGPGRAYARRVLEQARERGELRDGADIEVAIDQLAGSFLARHMAGLEFPEDWAETVADAVWRSVAR